MSSRKSACHSKEACLGKIKAAAIACFTEKGYAGTTVAEIARRAGLSPAALYLHVESKRALFDSLGREDLDRPKDHTLRKREQIIEAALQTFSEKGFAGASLEEIAAQVGLTRPALYAYFPSKQVLFSTLFEESPLQVAIDSLHSSLSDHETGSAPLPAKLANAERLLGEVARLFLGMFRESRNVSILRIILAEGSHDPSVSGIFIRVVEHGMSVIVGRLARLGFGADLELKPLVQAYMGMLLTWVIFNRAFSRTTASGRQRRDRKKTLDREEEAMADRAVRLFFHGIGRPKRRARASARRSS